MLRCFIILLIPGIQLCTAQRLERYNVDRNQISVSGISSGAAMAVQMHVAYSSSIMGVATFAGVPYFCAQGSALEAVDVCMGYPQDVIVGDLTAETSAERASGRINPTTSLANSRVFLFHGSRDQTVLPLASSKIDEYYTNYGANIQVEYNIPSGHGMPTESYGVSCGSSQVPWINNCGYNGAFAALSHIYGTLSQPSPVASGVFQQYGQSEFVDTFTTDSFDTIGYMYVPTTCQSGATACRLHIAFHGCVQAREEIGDEYARNAGYNEVAESNNIIMLYPQLVSDVTSNPNGCWDWWGYDDDNVFLSLDYHTQTGHQMTVAKRMIDRVAG